MVILSSFSADLVAERLSMVRDRIANAGVDPALVRVVAVTKGFGVQAVRAAESAGLQDIGENYATELLSKASALAVESKSPQWHFLGSIQRNKIKDLSRVVTWWHGISRSSELEELAARAPEAKLLIQVNASGESTKNGCDGSEVPELLKVARSLALDVVGLMTLGVYQDKERTKKAFRAVASIARHEGLEHLSMGMSDDLEEAVAEGSTMVRVGRALFGQRPLPST